MLRLFTALKSGLIFETIMGRSWSNFIITYSARGWHWGPPTLGKLHLWLSSICPMAGFADSAAFRQACVCWWDHRRYGSGKLHWVSHPGKFEIVGYTTSNDNPAARSPKQFTCLESAFLKEIMHDSVACFIIARTSPQTDQPRDIRIHVGVLAYIRSSLLSTKTD